MLGLRGIDWLLADAHNALLDVAQEAVDSTGS